MSAFVALVGASGSVLRAAAMAQLALVGRAAGRSGTAAGLLLWGTAFLAAWQPDIAGDVGWQLSFLGTAGLIWLGPLLAERLGRLPAAARAGVAGTIAAQVFVLPVLATTFGRVSLVAPLANALGLWLVPPIMAGGGALAVAASLLPPAAPLCAALTWVPTALLLRLIAWTAAVPGAAAGLPPWPAAVTLVYLAGLAALCISAERHPPAHPTPSTPAGPTGATGTAGAVGAAGGGAASPATALPAPAAPATLTRRARLLWQGILPALVALV
jgi:competence protein ComEC